MTTAPQPPNDFNWVKARHACSPFEVFKQLQLECERDVKERNELREDPARVVFKLVPAGEHFLVLREGRTAASVEFGWNKAGLLVRADNAAQPVQAQLTLNNNGECRLKVGTEELTFWQFRKTYLEELFFGGIQ